ncbi:thioesterase family protein [Tropicibacter naphthalenivorans]|uniref:Bifunctional 3-hydroxyacyl-CoA dehydrogenase/thioesterase n=1 Tax=Tropicibacter naphthalenivorans TaxID=441103 RepID=A0A0P1GHI2_9RHOB|nr:hypothetical protein [Tropicibacter naphthalenivorans]CUH81326.1 bifunctional 3-hydroxyacyl-CoA dehydrogenase/thioesterase [Tropicibacter naphthalenivorans]SMC98398.1 Acyl-CoA thioesterase FadM [Tropicibacter naphthalenivorans]
MSDPISALGVPTFHTRVEAWECDHNDHWNARHYMRVFRLASFVACDMAGASPGMPYCQLTRFHRELVQTAPVEIRSGVLADGPLAGALVHLLCSEGRLAATALETPGRLAHALPQVTSEQVKLALPRGLKATPHPKDAPDTAGFKVIEHGFVQPFEVDHTGALCPDRLMGRVAAATNERLAEMGFTPAYVAKTQISRMGVESRVTMLDAIGVGTRLRSTARIIRAEGKNLVVRHCFTDGTGAVRAASDQSLVTVDMRTRRACALPDIVMGKVDPV